MKFALVLIIDTRVVDVARVRARVKSVHMMKLKRRLRAKKRARMAYSTTLLEGEREREVETCSAMEVVRAVVVLEGGGTGEVSYFLISAADSVG